MADAAQDGRLGGVAPAERLDLERSLGQPFSVDRSGEQRREGGKHASGRALVDTDPLVDVQRSDDPVPRSQWPYVLRGAPRPGLRARCGPRRAERPGGIGGDAAELLLHAHALEQRGRDPRQQRRLMLPLLGLRSPATRAGSELADDDGGDEVDGKRDPVLSVGERERVERLEEEEVEGQHARRRPPGSRTPFPRRRRPAARRRRRARRG